MTALSEGRVWPVWRKIGFRFAFIYLLLYTTPWSLTTRIPGVSYVTQYYDIAWEWLVTSANAHIFHLYDQLVPFNGSGDTSFGWAQLCFGLLISVIACLVWSLLDRHRKNYEVLDYWLRLSVRYYIAYYCFSYGIIKIFAMQMYFPNTSQLATPLGDFLPMRLSWLFIGYSTPYQVFSGIMETVAGLLLLNRRTVTLGALLAVAVFTNVLVLNLSYDIPVKLFSAHLLLFSIFLVSYDLPRLFNFFVLNRVSDPATAFNIELSKKWQRYTRIVAKLTFIILAVVVETYQINEYYQSQHNFTDIKPIQSGMYDVDLFVLNNKDTIPALVSDTIRWHDMVFEQNGGGSIKTSDTLFRQRYRRGYFAYKPDTLKQVLELRYFPGDSLPIMSMRYKMPDEKTIQLWAKYKDDSLFVQLRKSKRHFQLAERQFHWLSEANR